MGVSSEWASEWELDAWFRGAKGIDIVDRQTTGTNAKGKS